MALKRTVVHLDEEDLRILKEAAARDGVPEAQLIRHGVHLAALGARCWEEEMDIPAFDFGDPTFADRAKEILNGFEGDE